eukprot:TRINITY_DN28445_c0_g1_i1.p1 TRINITY_DN28445_c0_g1~~TRINITY_DN28445_c0_g1_i1.p1  ORF type:complete len:561 (+),score=78.61 TRINITY_DN28445_c0_g1_i1:56-1684(+)
MNTFIIVVVLVLSITIAIYFGTEESLETAITTFLNEIGERGDALTLLISKGRRYPSRMHLLERILQEKEVPKTTGLTAVHFAAIHKEHSVLDSLLKHGKFQRDAKVVSGRLAGATPLHFALSSCMQQKIAVSRDLLRGGLMELDAFNLHEGMTMSPSLQALYTAPGSTAGKPVSMSVVGDAVNHWNNELILRSDLLSEVSISSTEASLQRTPAHFSALCENIELLNIIKERASTKSVLAKQDKLGQTVAHYLAAKGNPAYKAFDYDKKDILGRSASDVFLAPPTQRSSVKESTIQVGGGWSLGNANISVTNNCDIDVVQGELSPDRFFGDYLSLGRPVLMKGAASSWGLKKRWTRDSILKKYSKFEVEVGAIPYSSLFGMESKRVTLGEFIKKNMSEPSGSKNYVFHTFGDPDDGLTASVPHPPKFLKGIPSSLLRSSPGEPQFKGQFYLGTRGTGAPEHIHSDAWNALMYGAKSWWLAPPQKSQFSTTVPPGDYKPRDGLFYCQQAEGDILFVPSDWGHSTRNDDTTVGVAVEFRFARSFL